MISVRPQLPAPTEHAIDRLGDTDGESLDAAAQLAGPVGLDDEMDVIALDTVMEQSKPFVRCPRECRSRGGKDIIAPK